MIKLSRFKHKLSNFYYYVWGFWHKYSTVKSRHLPHTWVDRDQVLEYSVFEILEQFVEQEADQIGWYEYPKMIEVNGIEKNVRDEMTDILRWWNEVYLPFEDSGINMITDTPKSEFLPIENSSLLSWNLKYRDEEHKSKYEQSINEYNALKEKMNKDLTEYLIRIIKIKGYLWS